MGISRMLPIVLGDAGPAGLTYEEGLAAAKYLQEFEQRGFDADWSFDTGDAASLRSKTSNILLDATGKTVTYYGEPSKYLTLSSGGLNGLTGPTVDALEMTYAGVFLYKEDVPTGTIQVLMQTSDDDSVDGGEFAYFNTVGGVRLNVRGYAVQLEVTHAEMVAAGIDYGDWIYVAVSSRITSGVDTEHTLVVGATNPVVAVAGGTKLLSDEGNTIALGNAYTDRADYYAMSLDAQRFMTGAFASTAAELINLGKRVQLVAQRRGVAAE